MADVTSCTTPGHVASPAIMLRCNPPFIPLPDSLLGCFIPRASRELSNVEASSASDSPSESVTPTETETPTPEPSATASASPSTPPSPTASTTASATDTASSAVGRGGTDTRAGKDGLSSNNLTIVVVVGAILGAVAVVGAALLIHRRARGVPALPRPVPRRASPASRNTAPISNLWDTGVNTPTARQVHDVVSAPLGARPTVFGRTLAEGQE